MNTTAAPQAARDFTHTPLFEGLARAGYAARGVIYGLIGLLAIRLAQGIEGENADQQGALQTVADQPFGRGLLMAMAIGLGGYALWRATLAVVGTTPEAGRHSTLDRLGAAGSAIAYGFFCVAAISFLRGDPPKQGGQSQKAANDAFGLPLGRELVFAAGLVFLGIAGYQIYQGLSRKFAEDSKTVEMSPSVRRTFTVVGVVGLCARGVAFALIGWFVLKAAIDYNAQEAVGIDGALTSLIDESYGPVMLGVVAAGLIAFGVFSLFDARYRKI